LNARKPLNAVVFSAPLIAAALFLAGHAPAGPSPSVCALDDPVVDFAMADVRVDDAISLLARRAGVRVETTAALPERVRCEFRGARLSEAFAALAGADRHLVLRREDGFRIVPRPEGVTAWRPVPSPGALVSVVPAASAAPATATAAEAEEVLARHAERHPDDLNALILLGNIHRERRMLVSALEAWRRALRLAPDNASLRDATTQLANVIAIARTERARCPDTARREILDAYLR